MNPWADIDTLEDFNFYCCPECYFRSKTSCDFEKHAKQRHPLSEAFFVNKVKAEMLKDPLDDDMNELMDGSEHHDDPLLQIKMEPTEVDEFESDINDESDLDEHLSEQTEWTCEHEECQNQVFDDHQSLAAHNREFRLRKRQEKQGEATEQQTEVKSFRCKACYAAFKIENELKEHLKSIHGFVRKPFSSNIEGQKVYACQSQDCDLVFEIHKEMVAHRDSVHTGVWHCCECGQSCLNYDRLRRHILNVHRRVSCKKCGRDFGARSIDYHKCATDEDHFENKRQKLFDGSTCKMELTQDYNEEIKEEPRKFKCKACKDDFETQSELSEHLKAEHSIMKKRITAYYDKAGLRVYDCPNPSCDLKFENRSEMVAHRDSDHTNGVWHCYDCGHPCLDWERLRRHLKNIHRPVTCKKCGREMGALSIKNHTCTTSNPNKLVDDHMENEGKEDAGFAEEDTLMEMSESHHDGSRKFKCKACISDFESQSELGEHLKAEHSIMKKRIGAYYDITGLRVYDCPNPSCDLKFETRSEMVAHRDSEHTNGVWHCHDCGHSCLDYDRLRRHLLNVHRPVSCKNCGREMGALSIKNHVCSTSNSNRFMDDYVQDGGQEDVGFGEEDTLMEMSESHHDGSRKFKCKACNADLETQSDLRKHLKVEHCIIKKRIGAYYDMNGERVYDCPNPCCELQFLNQAEMVCHRDSVHAGDWNCYECGHFCVNYLKFRRHILNVHRRVPCKICRREFGSHSIEGHKCTGKYQNQDVTHEEKMHIPETCLQNDEVKEECNKFNCKTCSVDFETQSDFIEHMKSKHSIVKKVFKSPPEKTKNRSYICPSPDCELKFDFQADMISHRDSVHTGGWHCQDCGQFCENYHRLRRHIMNVHERKSCKNCGREFDERSIKAHEKICWAKDPDHPDEEETEYDDTMIICELCGKEYSLKSYQRHMKICNPNKEAVFQCSKCDEKFGNKAALKFHREAQHKEWPCSECGKIFPTYEKLDGHSNLHKYRPCEFCGKEISFAYISQHIKVCQVDVNDKRHVCDKCPYKTHSIIQFKQHRNGFHSEKFDFNLEGTELDEKGLVTCPECGKKFSLNGGYVNHYLRVHGCYPPGYPTNKIIKCDKCFKDYTSNNALKRHIRADHSGKIKTGPKPMQRVNCEYCGKVIRKDKLKKHVKNIHLRD